MYKILLLKENEKLEDLLSKNHYDVFSYSNKKDESYYFNKKSSVDLIIADISKNKNKVFKIIENIFRLYKQPKYTLPIIFITKNNKSKILDKIYENGVDYISYPFSNTEMLHKVSKQLEVCSTLIRLREHRNHYRSLLNVQENILFTTDEEEILSANQTFLDFFNVSSLEQFKKESGCITNLFLRHENYFNINEIDSNQFWIEYILKNFQEKECSVVLLDRKSFEPKVFKITINPVENKNQYMIALTDITILINESKKYENKAHYDELTSIYNRSKFNEILNKEFDLAKEKESSLSLIIFDIDHFKKINDTYGHLIGDDILKSLASLISKETKNKYTFARWGGEEFVIILSNTSYQIAIEFAEDLRSLIENYKFKEVNKVTCSFGVSSFMNDVFLENLLEKADKALYIAKQSGRNSVKYLDEIITETTAIEEQQHYII